MKIRTTLRPLSEGEISTPLGDEYVGLSLQIVLAQKIPMVFEEKKWGVPAVLIHFSLGCSMK